MRLPLVGPSGLLGSTAAAASECLNLYPEAIENPEDRTKNIGVLRGVPGHHLFAGLPSGVIRGVWSGGGKLFVVCGSKLYQMSQGTYIPNTPSTGSGAVVNGWDLGANDGLPAQMFGNGTQLAIVANGLLYVSNGGAPAQVFFTDRTTGLPTTDPVTTVTGAYLDSTLYVQRPAGGSPDLGRQVSYCQPNNFSLWYALDFFSKEGDATYIQSILADREQLYVFGLEESEVWQNDPSTGLPVRIPGAAAREGSVARYAPVSLAQSVFFLGGSPRGQAIAYKLRGFTPIRISTHAVEQAWHVNRMFAPEATSYAYIGANGHQFWAICFLYGPTWVYDETASQDFGAPQWHQRAQWDGISAFLPYPFRFHTFIPEWENGMHIVGDATSNFLYEMSDDYYDNSGADIGWRRAIPYRYAGGNRIFFGRQTLEMETGGGADAVTEGYVIRDYSDDRGKTFQNPQPAGSGVAGDGTRRVYWPTGGSSRGRVWRYFGHGQSRVTLIDLQGDETPGTA